MQKKGTKDLSKQFIDDLSLDDIMTKLKDSNDFDQFYLENRVRYFIAELIKPYATR